MEFKKNPEAVTVSAIEHAKTTSLIKSMQAKGASHEEIVKAVLGDVIDDEDFVKDKAMQEPNSHPFQTSNTEIRYRGDPDVTSLHVFSRIRDSFQEDETIVGVAIHVDSESETYSSFNGFYLTKGPATHNSLRSAVRLDGGVQLPSYHDNFADREYIHGFYTNKGNFITRRQAVWLIGENDLPTAVPKSEINSSYGAMSTDIWNEDGSPPKYDSRRSTQTVSKPSGGKTGFGHIPVKPVPRAKDSKGKVIPKTVSEMMREKRMKKNIRKFTGR